MISMKNLSAATLAVACGAACLLSSMQGRAQDVKPAHQRDDAQKADPEDNTFPDGMAHDFGKVQRGAQVSHAFRIVNTSNVPLKIVVVYGGGGTSRFLSARSSKEVLQPNEEGKVEVVVNTRNFSCTKVATIYVRVDNGKPTEHRLFIQANSCDDLAFFPQILDFGKIERGVEATKHMIVAVPDQPKLQITGASCGNKFIQVKVQELDRGKARVFFQVCATVRADAPEGMPENTALELTTNNPAMPKLFVPVSVQVVPAKR